MLLSNEQCEKQLIAFFSVLLVSWLCPSGIWIQINRDFIQRESVRGQRRMRQSIWDWNVLKIWYTHTTLLFTLFCVIFRYDFTLDGNPNKKRPNNALTHSQTNAHFTIHHQFHRMSVHWVVHHTRQITSYLLLFVTCYLLLNYYDLYLPKKQFYFQSDGRSRKNGRLRCRW